MREYEEGYPVDANDRYYQGDYPDPERKNSSNFGFANVKRNAALGGNKVREDATDYLNERLKVMPYESTEVLFDQRVEIVDSAPWMMESDIPVYDGDTVTVTFDGVEYKTTAMQTWPLAIFGNLASMGGEDNGMPFTIATGSTEGVPTTVIVAGDGTHSVKIEKMVAKPIDRKFVPGKVVYYWDGAGALTDRHGVPISVEKALNDMPNVVICTSGGSEYFFPFKCSVLADGQAVEFKFLHTAGTAKTAYAGTIPK